MISPAMQTSPLGRRMIEGFEGFKATAYRDIRGILTIGFGHTGCDVFVGRQVSQAEADAMLTTDLRRAELAVNTACKRQPNQNQFDAMVSLAYNVGASGFMNSTLVTQFNMGNDERASEAIMMWCHPVALTDRRNTERELFEKAA